MLSNKNAARSVSRLLWRNSISAYTLDSVRDTLCPKFRHCTHHYPPFHLIWKVVQSNHFFLPARWSCTLKLPGGTVGSKKHEKPATQTTYNTTSNIKHPGDCARCWDGFAGHLKGCFVMSSPDSSDAIGAIRTITLQHQRAAIPGWYFQVGLSAVIQARSPMNEGSQPHNFESLNDLTISYDS